LSGKLTYTLSILFTDDIQDTQLYKSIIIKTKNEDLRLHFYWISKLHKCQYQDQWERRNHIYLQTYICITFWDEVYPKISEW